MPPLITNPSKFVALFNEKFPDASRRITIEDVISMTGCNLICRHDFYSREDLETVRGILQYEKIREKRSKQESADDKLGLPKCKMFAPGARNKFHTHSVGQILYVTEGKGIVATKEKEYIVTPGMVVFISPGEVHWHGATEDSSFAHLSIIGQPGEMKIVEE